MCLKTVYDVAQSEFREHIPPASFNSELLDLNHLEVIMMQGEGEANDFKGLSSWEASFVASIQMRVSQKGTQGIIFYKAIKFVKHNC